MPQHSRIFGMALLAVIRDLNALLPIEMKKIFSAG